MFTPHPDTCTCANCALVTDAPAWPARTTTKRDAWRNDPDRTTRREATATAIDRVYCGHTFAGRDCKTQCPHVGGHCAHCELA